MDEERNRQSTAVESLKIADHSNQDLRKKLTEEKQARKSADSALAGEQKQVGDQRLLLRDAKEQLASSKEQEAALQKKLAEAQEQKEHAERAREGAERAWKKAEKAREDAQQHGHNIGVAETENALRAEVPAVCRAYCTLT